MKITPYGHEFLSNRYGHVMVFRGETYPTAENAFQASRFLSPDMRRKISYMPSYHAAYCGRTYRTTVPGWRERRYAIMYEVLRAKFADRELAAALKATGDAEIVMENNWHDNDFGVCTCRKCRHIENKKNVLGILLMRLREEI